jgi:regulator of sirC expression with transglutaminase-like and TPR domain
MDAELGTFRDVVCRADGQVDLGLAALTVARIEHPDLRPEQYLPWLDDLARRSKIGHAPDHRRALERLRRFLFEEEGFRGNAQNYYDPRNSCLNDVLERKLGIPITLSVLTMEVARRAGLAVEGIGLPGHFIVRARVDGEEILLDPFHGGAVLSTDEAAAVAARAVGRPVTLADAHWTPCTAPQILIRMLRNLKTAYVEREDWARSLGVIDRLLMLDADSRIHLRDRGTVLVKLGRLWDGATEWERYLTRFPDAQDAARFREELRRVRQELAIRN